MPPYPIYSFGSILHFQFLFPFPFFICLRGHHAVSSLPQMEMISDTMSNDAISHLQTNIHKLNKLVLLHLPHLSPQWLDPI